MSLPTAALVRRYERFLDNRRSDLCGEPFARLVDTLILRADEGDPEAGEWIARFI